MIFLKMFSFLQFMIGMQIVRHPSIVLLGIGYYTLYLGCNQFCENIKEIHYTDNSKNLSNYKKYLSNYKKNTINKTKYFNY